MKPIDRKLYMKLGKVVTDYISGACLSKGAFAKALKVVPEGILGTDWDRNWDSHVVHNRLVAAISESIQDDLGIDDIRRNWLFD